MSFLRIFFVCDYFEFRLGLYIVKGIRLWRGNEDRKDVAVGSDSEVDDVGSAARATDVACGWVKE